MSNIELNVLKTFVLLLIVFFGQYKIVLMAKYPMLDHTVQYKYHKTVYIFKKYKFIYLNVCINVKIIQGD